jgi:hypothetical protein
MALWGGRDVFEAGNEVDALGDFVAGQATMAGPLELVEQVVGGV